MVDLLAELNEQLWIANVVDDHASGAGSNFALSAFASASPST
jgi:hypothetical protein